MLGILSWCTLLPGFSAAGPIFHQQRICLHFRRVLGQSAGASESVGLGTPPPAAELNPKVATIMHLGIHLCLKSSMRWARNQSPFLHPVLNVTT